MQAVGFEHHAAGGCGAEDEFCSDADQTFQTAGAAGGCAEHADRGFACAEKEGALRAALDSFGKAWASAKLKREAGKIRITRNYAGIKTAETGVKSGKNGHFQHKSQEICGKRGFLIDFAPPEVAL